MKKYLYLTHREWVTPWVEGGSIPLRLASAYRRDEREGIYTPDENLIHTSPIPMPAYANYGFGISLGSRNITIVDCSYNGREIPDMINGSYYQEDALILCLSNRYSFKIARKMGKVACVEIKDVNKLAKFIDKQLEVKSEQRDCGYTRSHQRNHFLKGIKDAWQDEYRLVWKLNEEQEVILPKGIGHVKAYFD